MVLDMTSNQQTDRGGCNTQIFLAETNTGNRLRRGRETCKSSIGFLDFNLGFGQKKDDHSESKIRMGINGINHSSSRCFMLLFQSWHVQWDDRHSGTWWWTQLLIVSSQKLLKGMIHCQHVLTVAVVFPLVFWHALFPQNWFGGTCGACERFEHNIWSQFHHVP